jgi:hypothetical protein
VKPGAAYYAGGVRVIVEGVPIRMARKPSELNLARLRKHERERVKIDSNYYSRAEKAAYVAQKARDAIRFYADRLDITENRAKALIAVHRKHLAQNPLIDLSLEYDL